MKTFYFFLLSLILSVSLFAQQKEQVGRYQIFKVASMTKEYNSNPKFHAWGSGGNDDVILLDTQTGRTWLLTIFAKEASEDGGSKGIFNMKFEWVEIHYALQEISHIDDPTFFPPPDKKKK